MGSDPDDHAPPVPGFPGIRLARTPRLTYAKGMEVVRLGKKGQLSLPKAVLQRLGLTGEALLLVDVTPEGGILLRPAGIYPIELYSQARVTQFLAEDRMTRQEARRVKRRTRSTA